ncbi:MAG TPA: glycosyltransferase family 39 protein [Micropepsaceae bacterium]|jgi:4-amino-4-deoxy-L-arabinose transferase-like glycosyltransferase
MRSISHENPIRAVVLCVLALILVRGIVAGLTPLSYDEAYYWLWSKHLAAGYLDHPPLIAFTIAAGTALFGDTSWGVRFVPWLLSVLASWAVWRSGRLILKSEYGAVLAALFFNVMPMIGVEALVATPDSPQIAAAAFLLLTLAKVAETGNGLWWIAAGVAAGFALLSKYTGFFLGVGILAWLAIVPRERRWFLSFWPYLGAAIGLLMFVPVLLWNAEHDWISFAKQFGRLDEGGFTLRFLVEFLGGQLALATPFIAILGVAGVVMIFRSREGMRSEPALLFAMIAPPVIYFAWHALHDRVQGNWPSFLYPAFVLAAAATCLRVEQKGSPWFLRLSRRIAVPFAGAMLAVVYAQALWGIIPRVRDPVSRLLAFGIDPVANQIEALRNRTHARAVLTTGYALTGWLSFYLPSHPPVVQVNERVRYLDEPEPPRALFEGPLLYVTETRNDQSQLLAAHFARIMPLAHISRVRNGATIDEYAIYGVSGLKGYPLDQGR